jgi:hypothetical protein
MNITHSQTTIFKRWTLGWTIWWRTIVFSFWVALFSLPTTIIFGICEKIPGEKINPEITFIVSLLVALINVPLALNEAALKTGFFWKREDHV